MLSHRAGREGPATPCPTVQPPSPTAGQEPADSSRSHRWLTTHRVAGAGLSHTEFPLESATLPSVATGTCDEGDRELTHHPGQGRV